ncbi:MAG: hypothetical protein JNL69_12380 [Bacteroidia bacterium]|nr:hypothetical protein [Bacteroidia bacterium]
MTQKLIGNKESKIKTFFKVKAIYIVMIVTVLGLFGGIPSVFFLFSKTIIGIGEVLILLTFSSILGLLQWKYLKNLLEIEYRNFVMYAFAGFGMCLLSFLLYLNYIITIESNQQTYTIDRISVHYGEYDITLVGEDVNLDLERVISSYATEHYEIIPVSSKVKVFSQKGILGFSRVKKCVFER